MALPDPNSNAETIEKVYAGYRQELLGFFRKLARKKDRVEDLVQAVYLGLQRCRTLPSVDKPKQFLYRIAWNVLRSDNRSIDRERKLMEDLNSREWEDIFSTNEQLRVDDSSAAIDQAHFEQMLSALTSEQRIVFTLHYRDGKSYQEITDATGVKFGTVKKHLSKAMAHLHACYPDGIPE